MSTIVAKIEIRSSPDRISLRLWLGLGLLSLALGYAVLQQGAQVLTDWNVCLLLLAGAALTEWAHPITKDVLTGKARANLLPILFLGYICFQLLPLPIGVLRVLSPERARILYSLTPVAGPLRFAPLSITSSATFVYLFRFIGYTLAFLLVRDTTRRFPARLRWLSVVPIVVFAVLEAVIGLSQNSGDGAQGTYPNRNLFAGSLEMAMPFALAGGFAYLQQRKSTVTWSGTGSIQTSRRFIVLGIACVSAAALIFVGLLASLSKMGFIAGMSALFTVAALAITSQLRGLRRGLSLAAVLALSLFLLVFLPSDELVDRFAGVTVRGDAAAEGRWPIWKDTLRLVESYPVFGSGLGTYDVAFLKYQASIVDDAFDFAHNDYLQLIAELGLAGALILAALLIPIAGNAFRAALRCRDPNNRWIAIGCAGSFAAIGLHSFVDFNTYIPANALVLAWIGGVASGIPTKAKPTTPPAPNGPIERRFALVLAGLVIVYAPAWIVFRTAFRSNPRAEEIFCKFGICDTDAVITGQTLAHVGDVSAIPQALLLTALRRDPNSPDRWCDASEGYARAGNWNQAAFCLRRAQDLGPNIPPVLMRVSDGYLGLHQIRQSLEPRAHILSETGTYDDLIFDWYRGRKLPIDVTLSTGLPEDARAGQSYLRYLMNLMESREATAVWNWNIKHGFADERVAKDYIRFLMDQQKYEQAAQTWAQYLGPRRNGYLESNWVFNGDFENEFSGSVFDWRIDPRDDVEITPDPTMAKTGARSLRIVFKGNENLNFSQVSQTAFVKPGRYRFEAFLRTQDLTTDEGIGFQIFDPAESSHLSLKTDRLTGTHDWTKVVQIVEVPSATKLIVIQMVRQPSLKFDNKINGTVWIDGVKLIRSNL